MKSLLILFASSVVFAADSNTAVVVISLDGVGFQQLQKIDPDFVKEKNLCSTVAADPSYTFPGHANIATGADPKTHQVRRNEDINCKDVRLGWRCNNNPDRLHAKPLWTKASEIGFSTRTYLWPMSYGPWQKIHHHRDQSYPAQLTYETGPLFDDVADFLENWDVKSNALYMGWMDGLDRIGHRTGTESDRFTARWKELKAAIEGFEQKVEVLRKKGKHVQLIFVSDHGLVNKTDPETGRVYGDHGDDPKNAALNGVYWGYPKLPREDCPGKMTDIAGKVFSQFGLEWRVESQPSTQKHFLKKQDSPMSRVQ